MFLVPPTRIFRLNLLLSYYRTPGNRTAISRQLGIWIGNYKYNRTFRKQSVFRYEASSVIIIPVETGKTHATREAREC